MPCRIAILLLLCAWALALLLANSVTAVSVPTPIPEGANGGRSTSASFSPLQRSTVSHALPVRRRSAAAQETPSGGAPRHARHDHVHESEETADEDVHAKYVEAERRIKEAWAAGGTLDPHELDPNHPAHVNDESYGHDPLLDRKTRAPLPPHGLDKEPQEESHDVENTNYTVDIVDANAPQFRSLHEAVHEDAMITNTVLFGYRQDNCETCAGHLAQFFDVCNDALEAERGRKRVHRHVRCAFWDVGRAKPRDLRYLNRLNPHFHWRVPWVVVIPTADAGLFVEHADPVDVHYSRFAEDLAFHIKRHVASDEMTQITSEHTLLDAIFDSHNDGVTVVLFHDEQTPHFLEGKGRVFEYFTRVRDEEKAHVHFAHVVFSADGPGKTLHSPEFDWLDEYNPTAADVVAYLASPDRESFRAAPFNFSHCDGRWENFKGILELRDFVDEVKGFRHAASGRRFRGIRKVRHYELLRSEDGRGSEGGGDDEYVVVSAGSSIETGSCQRQVQPDDRIVASVRGVSADHGAEFLRVTDEVLVAGRVPQLPPAAQHVFDGMCPGQKKDVYIPPSHGFHAEHFFVAFKGFADDGEVPEELPDDGAGAERGAQDPDPLGDAEIAELARLLRDSKAEVKMVSQDVAPDVHIIGGDGGDL